MNIKILGPSCANCLKLELLVMQALAHLNIRDATVEKIAVAQEMERYLTGEPPGLVVNGQLVWAGGKELPTESQVRDLIREVLAAAA